jgi:hypothetical protein
MNINLVYEDDFLKISFLDESNSSRCLVAFNGIGHSVGAIDIQREEFFSHHKLGMVVWITDKKRSWGNNLNLEKVYDTIKNLIKDREVFIIGNSMGGFLAILFSSILNAKKVLSIVPQFSVSPNIVPSEKRWMKYRKKIKSFVYEDLTAYFNKDIDYAILLGGGDLEEIHYQKFMDISYKPNVSLYKLLDAEHNVARYLKELKILNECVDIFFGGGLLSEFFNQNSIKLFEPSQKGELK